MIQLFGHQTKQPTRKFVDHVIVIGVAGGDDEGRVDVAVGVEHVRSNHLVEFVVVQGAKYRIAKIDLTSNQDGRYQKQDCGKAIVELKDLKEKQKCVNIVHATTTKV